MNSRLFHRRICSSGSMEIDELKRGNKEKRKTLEEGRHRASIDR